MDTITKRSVVVKDREICYQLERKNVKNLLLAFNASIIINKYTTVPMGCEYLMDKTLV